jgi:polyisoprenyl-phosphate glycosyltransferase
MLNVVILMPVYNDWESARLLWGQLDRVARESGERRLRILCVDDGSTAPLDHSMDAEAFSPSIRIDVLRLKRNVGHQRAYAIGLTYIFQHLQCDAVLCMDADGEDRVEDIVPLLARFEALGRNHAVFAARKRRLESRVFQFGYLMFRWAHRVLVGVSVRIGNFSVLPFNQLAALVVSPDLWSHYAATVLKLRISMSTVPIDRGRRLVGRSRMNYVSLVTHGLSAFSVFSEVVATRILIGGTIGFLIVTLLFAGLLALHSFLRFEPGNWTIAAVVLVFVAITNAVMMALSSAFGVLVRRDQLGFLPIRDASYFVSEYFPLYESPRAYSSPEASVARVI